MKEYRILHLEDSSSDADLIKRSLQKAGLNFQYLFSDSEESFVQGITEFKPNVILCDHALPQFDSVRALEIYHQMNLEIPFILVTGSVSEEYAVEMMKKGIDDYLLKINLQRLPQAIKKAYCNREKEKLYKLGEAKLKQSELLLNKAQQIAHIGSWGLDIETGKVIWSNEIFKIFGTSLEEVEPSLEVFLSYIHPKDLSFVKHNIKHAQAEFRDMSFYTRIIHKDGTVRYVYIENKFEFNKQGKPIRLLGIIHDITEKKLADREKEFDQQNLSALINNTNDLLWSVDRNLNLLTSNQAFDERAKLLYGKSITKGSNIFDLGFGEEQLSRLKKFYERALSGETFTEIEFNNSLWSEISFYPIRKENVVSGTACYLRDITESKKTEQEILQKNKQLLSLTSHLQHVREEERTAISREIHDELGQQLTALKMEIDWVLHKQNNAEEKIVTKLNEMLQMSDGVINTIRRISSDLRPAIIDDLGLVAALEWKCNDFEEKTGIACHFVSTVKERKFDADFGINTYRILQETLTNVSRHSGAKSVNVSVSENETELFLEITDNGKGIAENAQNGKTLGIIGMKERAALLDGKLIIEGTKNKGTRTKLILPFKN